MASIYLTKLIVDGVTAGLKAPDKGVAFGHVAFLIGLAGAVALIIAFCSSIASLVSEAQTQVITDDIHDLLHAKSIEVDLEYYENPQYYDTLHRAQHEAPYRPTQIMNSFVKLGQSGISLLAIAGFLFSFHWGIALVMFGAAIPDILVRIRFSGKFFHWQRTQTLSERLAAYFSWMLTSEIYAKEIRLFNLGSLLLGRFRELRKKLRQERIALAFRRSAAELSSQIVSTLAIFGVFGFVAYQAIKGSITLGDMVMYYQAFQRGGGFLKDMLSGLASLYENSLFLSSFYEFLDLKKKVKEPLYPKPIHRPMKTGIAFDHVGFQYPTGRNKLLDDISLTVQPGETVALVGENGSGKTTLIKLLCRLYDPTEGIITLDGVDLREFESARLRHEISVIFQDYAQYHLTAQENIWFGNVDIPPDQEQIVAAARRSGAHDMIEGFKHRYETILGKWFENGEVLSPGQWQKIALARAFLRDSQIVVLDEPTSALDAKAEYEVFKKFRQLTKGRAAIIISHRFSTVRMADRIYVLGNGRIAESGTHHELVSLGGRYAMLFEIQAQSYK